MTCTSTSLALPCPPLQAGRQTGCSPCLTRQSLNQTPSPLPRHPTPTRPTCSHWTLTGPGSRCAWRERTQSDPAGHCSLPRWKQLGVCVVGQKEHLWCDGVSHFERGTTRLCHCRLVSGAWFFSGTESGMCDPHTKLDLLRVLLSMPGTLFGVRLAIVLPLVLHPQTR